MLSNKTKSATVLIIMFAMLVAVPTVYAHGSANASSGQTSSGSGSQQGSSQAEGSETSGAGTQMFGQDYTQEERQALIDEWKSSTKEQVCERRQTNIQKREQYYAQNHERLHNQYQTLANNVDNAIAKLKQAGVSSTKLEQIQAEFKNEIQEMVQLKSQLVVSLRNMRGAACDEDTKQFKGDLAEAQIQLQLMRDQSVSIKDLLKYELKTELLKIKNVL